MIAIALTAGLLLGMLFQSVLSRHLDAKAHQAVQAATGR